MHNTHIWLTALVAALCLFETEVQGASCPANTYESAPSICEACPANTVSGIGAQNVSFCKCRAGYFSADGTAPCSQCTGNSFTDTIAQTSCTSCNVSACEVGRWRGPCAPNHDAKCHLCTGAPLDAFYTSTGNPFDANNCTWDCMDGFRKENGTCVDCNAACPVGQFRAGCGCVDCVNWKPADSSYENPQGTLTSLSQCEWDCDFGNNVADPQTCAQRCQ